jgi:ABC-2 type transport system permease protein
MSALTFAAQDSATMLGREIKHSIRLLRLLIVSAIVVPVVMMLMFDYILGGMRCDGDLCACALCS